MTPNRSRYPRSAFFDSQDHLNESAQIAHSMTIAQALSHVMSMITLSETSRRVNHAVRQ